jgi:hypothetical protein
MVIRTSHYQYHTGKTLHVRLSLRSHYSSLYKRIADKDPVQRDNPPVVEAILELIQLLPGLFFHICIEAKLAT